jgi:hypothetical protein
MYHVILPLFHISQKKVQALGLLESKLSWKSIKKGWKRVQKTNKKDGKEPCSKELQKDL